MCGSTASSLACLCSIFVRECGSFLYAAARAVSGKEIIARVSASSVRMPSSSWACDFSRR
eukprot:4823150-Prymnesium_polylepis.1